MIKREICLLFICVLLALIVFTYNDQPYAAENICFRSSIDDLTDYTEVNSAARLVVNCVVVINILCIAGTFFADYITTASEDVHLTVIHESFKNVKQYPRGTIDNRTYVRYNNTIAILVRAVNGGTENGRIQEINNRYGKFAYG